MSADEIRSPLDGRRVAVVATDGVEQVELTEPWSALREAGAVPALVSIEPGRIQGFNHLDKGDSFDVDALFTHAEPADYDALLLPGGVANPDRLRTDAEAVAFVRSFAEAGRPVAVICHGPWTLVEADVVRGRTLTSWPSLRTDIRNAGGTWVDEEVFVCSEGPGPIVSSRKPADLPAFCQKVVEVFSQSLHAHTGG